MSFPAKKIDLLSTPETQVSFDRAIVSPDLKTQLAEMQTWAGRKPLKSGRTVTAKTFTKGFKALFVGPPGTGKTIAAATLGMDLKTDVYRVDLSMVFSKYIGETEKNIDRLFSTAEKKGWILFFDEADALFGKRTEVRDAHDKYANQEVAYLLQRLEQHDGLVILAAGKRGNIDSAFLRRLNAILDFSRL